MERGKRSGEIKLFFLNDLEFETRERMLGEQHICSTARISRPDRVGARDQRPS